MAPTTEQPCRESEPPHRDGCPEGADCDERPAVVGIERNHADGAQIELAGCRCAASPTLDTVDAHATGDDELLVATRDAAAQHHIGALGHDGVPHSRLRQLGPHDTSVGCVASGDPHQRLTVEVKTRLSIDTLDDDSPFAGGRVEQVDVDLGPLHHHVHQHEPAIAADGDIGPRLGRGLAIEHGRVGGRVGAEAVEADVAVVLVALRVHRVPEAGVIGQPRDAGRTRVADAQRQHQPGGHFHHVQHAVLGATLAEPVGHERTIVRWVEPIDGDRTVSGECGRVEQGAGRRRRVGCAAQHERELVGAGGPLDHEQVVAGDRERQRGGQRGERGKALVPPAPGGPSNERLASSLVVCCHPLGDFGDSPSSSHRYGSATSTP